MNTLKEAAAVEAEARKAVAETTVTDVHTHLFPPAHGKLLRWGIDELLTYHYLAAELFTVAPRELRPERFWRMPKQAQAELVWEHVFLHHGALSEAARGVITTLSALGLDVAGRDLKSIRQWFAAQSAGEYLPKVFKIANIDYAVMTNDPFKAEEASYWNAGAEGVENLKAALRLDTLILDWPVAAATMLTAGYDTAEEPNKRSLSEARRFLADWAKRIQPVYLAASMPADFHYPNDDMVTRVLEGVVLPAARELGMPVALMIGVRRGLNPALGEAGDGVGVADVSAVTNLCGMNPENKFLVTMLSRVNQHELCVAARKFSNLHLFGCWWFCNNPSIIEEITRQRLELLGATFTCQHSDARVLDQLIYKWAHARTIVADVLADKYADLFLAGWRCTKDEIRRDVRNLFGGMFEEFLAK